MKKSIAIDMDGVIADVESHFITWYERDYGIKVSPSELIGRSEETAFPEKGTVRKFASTPGFFRTVPVMEGAIEAVAFLSKRFDVYIVSAAMEFPQSLAEKLEWLQVHFPFIGWRYIIFCGDKSIVNTDFMIDDHIKNLDTFKGKAIMFNAFHNVAYKYHRRANNWKEILSMFESESGLL
ncbi:MAG: 5'(3')-deoxyribonucleotidase [Chitinophagaceae bacterium]